MTRKFVSKLTHCAFAFGKLSKVLQAAGAKAPLHQLPFFHQGVAAKVSDTTMLRKDKLLAPKIIDYSLVILL